MIGSINFLLVYTRLMIFDDKTLNNERVLSSELSFNQPAF